MTSIEFTESKRIANIMCDFNMICCKNQIIGDELLSYSICKCNINTYNIPLFFIDGLLECELKIG